MEHMKWRNILAHNLQICKESTTDFISSLTGMWKQQGKLVALRLIPQSRSDWPHHFLAIINHSIVNCCRLPTQLATPRQPHNRSTVAMSAPDPKEAWARLQNELTRRTQRMGGSGGGGPKGILGGMGGLVLLGGGIWVANNALFNGA